MTDREKALEQLNQLDTVLNKVMEGEVIITLTEIKHDDNMKYVGSMEIAEKVISSTTNKIYLMDKIANIDFVVDKKNHKDLLLIKSLYEMHRGKFTQAHKQNENKVYDLKTICCLQEDDLMYRIDFNKPMIFMLDDSDRETSTFRVVYDLCDVNFGIQEIDKYKVEEDYQYWATEQEELLKREMEDEEIAEGVVIDDTGYDDYRDEDFIN